MRKIDGFNLDDHLVGCEVITEDMGDGETCRFKRKPIGKGAAVELSQHGEGVLVLNGGDGIGFEFWWTEYIAELVSEINMVTVPELLNALYARRRDL